MVPSRPSTPAPIPGCTTLPSGRTVTASAGTSGEQIEIRSAGGDLELRIALTPAGPVLQLRGVKLEIDSTDSVAVRCKDFEIAASESVRLTASKDVELRAQGELKVKTQGQMHIDGEVINLNSGDRTDYPDGQPGWSPPPVPGLPEAPPPPGTHEGGCDCGHGHR